MPFEVISTNQTTTFEFSDFDTVTLLEGVSLTSSSFGFTGDPVTGTALNGSRLNVLGSVSSQSTGIDLFTQVSTVTSTHILVGTTGSIFSAGLAMSLKDMSNASVTNQGSLFSTNNTISVGSVTTQLAINNSGSMTCTDNSVIRVFANGGGVTEVVNSGVMISTAATSLAALEFDGIVEISNSGSISAANGLAILATEGVFDDRLSNTGLIDGEVALGQGNDVVFNYGTIIGSVVLDAGDDQYRAAGDGDVSGSVRGGAGNDDLFGARAEDYLIGGNGNDKIKGRAGEDTLEGGNGRDIILGGDGDDEIIGGNAGDLMLGGAGSDAFVFTDTGDIGTSGATRDEIRDFEQGVDIINLAAMVGPDFIFLGTGGFTSGSAPELRLVEVGGSTFVQLDYDGDGTQDGRMLVRGVVDMTQSDFIL